jgi:hypothetical protein
MAFLVLDESERGEFLVVGGLIVPNEAIVHLEREWRQFKASYGLRREDPLKWAPERELAQRLKTLGRYVNDVRRDVCAWLGQRRDVAALAVVLQERRTGILRPGRGGVRDFYATGVAFCVQRFARLASENSAYASKPHAVLIDSIGWSRGRRSEIFKDTLKRMMAKLRWGGKRRSIMPWMAEGYMSLLREYKQWLDNGFTEVGVQQLAALGFLSSLVEGHGGSMDILQMADFVAGCAAELFFSVAAGRTSAVPGECMRALIPVMCQVSGFGSGVWGCGIVLYPPNERLWRSVQAAVSSSVTGTVP